VSCDVSWYLSKRILAPLPFRLQKLTDLRAQDLAHAPHSWLRPRLANVICPVKLKTLWYYTRYSHCIGWVDPIASMEAVVKGNICCPLRKANSVICCFLACSQATIQPERCIVLLLVREVVVLSGRQKNWQRTRGFVLWVNGTVILDYNPPCHDSWAGLKEFAISMRYCATYSNLLIVYVGVLQPASCQAARLPTVGCPRQFNNLATADVL